MVEHLALNQKDPVQIRRRPAIRPPSKNTSFHSRSAILFSGRATYMDYTQFLQKPDEVLRLPYFGGKSVCDDKLTYRLRDTLPPGWYQFRKSGRYLTVGRPDPAGAGRVEAAARHRLRVQRAAHRQRFAGPAVRSAHRRGLAEVHPGVRSQMVRRPSPL